MKIQDLNPPSVPRKWKPEKSAIDEPQGPRDDFQASRAEKPLDSSVKSGAVLAGAAAGLGVSTAFSIWTYNDLPLQVCANLVLGTMCGSLGGFLVGTPRPKGKTLEPDANHCESHFTGKEVRRIGRGDKLAQAQELIQQVEGNWKELQGYENSGDKRVAHRSYDSRLKAEGPARVHSPATNRRTGGYSWGVNETGQVQDFQHASVLWEDNGYRLTKEDLKMETTDDGSRVYQRFVHLDNPQEYRRFRETARVTADGKVDYEKKSEFPAQVTHLLRKMPNTATLSALALGGAVGGLMGHLLDNSGWGAPILGVVGAGLAVLPVDPLLCGTREKEPNLRFSFQPHPFVQNLRDSAVFLSALAGIGAALAGWSYVVEGGI